MPALLNFPPIVNPLINQVEILLFFCCFKFQSINQGPYTLRCLKKCIFRWLFFSGSNSALTNYFSMPLKALGVYKIT